MACIVETASEERRRSRGADLWYKLSLVFPFRKRKRLPLLELQVLSDHLKRDLGFLDGRG